MRSYPQQARAHRELRAALLVTSDTVAARSSLSNAPRLAPGDTATARRLRGLGAP
ncbi:MAG: hypothetical protein IPJ78_04520 [Gemmatimonadetes bacterium]|nr:hypothetical protein [Gemmatimonadota bacterium]